MDFETLKLFDQEATRDVSWLYFWDNISKRRDVLKCGNYERTRYLVPAIVIFV